MRLLALLALACIAQAASGLVIEDCKRTVRFDEMICTCAAPLICLRPVPCVDRS